MTTTVRSLDALPSMTRRTTEPLVLTQEDIRCLLPMYKPDAVFMREAVLRNSRLYATFDTFPHPFTRCEPKHLTREHALAFVTQAAYVFASLMPEHDATWPVDCSRFQKLSLAEQATFTRISLHFRRFIRNRGGMRLEIWCDRLRVYRRRIYGRLRFCFPDGCEGFCDALIALDGSLVPQ